MPIETQYTINSWQQVNFPQATTHGVVAHLREEFEEFLNAASEDEAAVEAADIVIILYCWAMLQGFDLHAAIDAKMRINRSRQWHIQPDGTGRHK